MTALAFDPQPRFARSFAIVRHGDQRYGEQPYAVHLDAVAVVLKPYGPLAQVVGYLHDVCEDTPTTVEEMAEHFGPFAAACVGLLTDEPGGDRAARKERTHRKLAAVSAEFELALIAKAGDRLCNVRACVAGGHSRLLEVYRREHPAFRAAAYRPGLCGPIWRELDALLDLPGDGAAGPQ